MGRQHFSTLWSKRLLDLKEQMVNLQTKMFKTKQLPNSTRTSSERKDCKITDYFHGDTAKEEAHPFRIFMIVRDFLNSLDQVCKEVGRMQDRTVVGLARSFKIAASASLPVLNRYHARQDKSSDEESLSP